MQLSSLVLSGRPLSKGQTTCNQKSLPQAMAQSDVFRMFGKLPRAIQKLVLEFYSPFFSKQFCEDLLRRLLYSHIQVGRFGIGLLADLARMAPPHPHSTPYIQRHHDEIAVHGFTDTHSLLIESFREEEPARLRLPQSVHTSGVSFEYDDATEDDGINKCNKIFVAEAHPDNLVDAISTALLARRCRHVQPPREVPFANFADLCKKVTYFGHWNRKHRMEVTIPNSPGKLTIKEARCVELAMRGSLYCIGCQMHRAYRRPKEEGPPMKRRRL
jgi:hypothetical protein